MPWKLLTGDEAPGIRGGASSRGGGGQWAGPKPSWGFACVPVLALLSSEAFVAPQAGTAGILCPWVKRRFLSSGHEEPDHGLPPRRAAGFAEGLQAPLRARTAAAASLGLGPRVSASAQQQHLMPEDSLGCSPALVASGRETRNSPGARPAVFS